MHYARIRNLLSNMRSCSSGNVLPMAASGLIVLTALIGGSVDISRAYRVQNRLQSACDAGVLAGRSAVKNNGFDDGAAEQAQNYFDANFDEQAQGATTTTFAPTTEDNGSSIQATASTNVKTAIMQVFGFENLPLSVECQASMGIGNSDITMVLDTTGSMAWELSDDVSRIDALRSSMKTFYETVAETTSGTNARIRYAFVPYSSSVNVGQLLYDENPNYLVDSYTYQSRRWVSETRYEQILVGWSDPQTTTSDAYSEEDPDDWERYDETRYRTVETCQAAIPANVDWADHGSPDEDEDDYIDDNGNQIIETTTTQNQRKTEYGCLGRGSRYYVNSRYVYRDYITTVTEKQAPIYGDGDPYDVTEMQYLPINYDTSAFKTFAAVSTSTGTNGAAESSVWDGCIIERSTVASSDFTFSSSTGINPTNALDLNIDSAPDPTNPSTQWAPMWSEISYLRGDWVRPRRGSPYLNPVFQTQYTSGALANAYCPVQSQLLTEMEQDDFDEFADNLVPRGSTYHDIGLIWGARLSSPLGIFADNVNEEADNGASVSRHIIFMTDGEMAPNNEILTTYGIEFFDRRVTADGSSEHTARHNSRFLAVCEAIKAKGIRLWVIAMATGLSSDLSTCASPGSATTANDTETLEEAFENIAKQVGELRIVN